MKTSVKTRMKKSERGGELRVVWNTPIGPMSGLVSAQGVRELRFPEEGQRTKDKEQIGEDAREDTCGPGVEITTIEGDDGGEGAALREAAAVTEFLRNYFAGGDTEKCPRLDMESYGDFDRAVWEAARAIGRGRTKTYGQIAEEIGRPGAARAVGGALGRNPLVLMVPCHRVLAAGTGAKAIGGFTGGIEMKRWLLEMEKK